MWWRTRALPVMSDWLTCPARTNCERNHLMYRYHRVPTVSSSTIPDSSFFAAPNKRVPVNVAGFPVLRDHVYIYMLTPVLRWFLVFSFFCCCWSLQMQWSDLGPADKSPKVKVSQHVATSGVRVLTTKQTACSWTLACFTAMCNTVPSTTPNEYSGELVEFCSSGNLKSHDRTGQHDSSFSAAITSIENMYKACECVCVCSTCIHPFTVE